MASSHRSVSPPPRPPLVDSVAVVLPPPTDTPTATPSNVKARVRRERLAWIVVLGAFLTFLILGIGVPFFTLRFVRTAQAVRDGEMEVIRPIVLVLNQQGAKSGVTDMAPVGEGQTIVTDNESRALVTLFDGSTIQVYPDTSLRITALREPRFARYGLSHRANDLGIELLNGTIRVGVALPPAGRPRPNFTVTTPHLAAKLVEGGYFLDTTQAATDITAYNQDATVTSQWGSAPVTLHRGQRTQVLAGQAPQAPQAAEVNLVTNGDFSAATEGTWKVSVDQGGDGPSIDPIWDVTNTGDRDALHLFRTGSEFAPGRGNHASLTASQTLNKNLPDPYSSLKLQAQVRVNEQSLSGGGYLDTEYPLMLRVVYKDAYGSEHEWWRGFYIQNAAGNPTTHGEPLRKGVWTPVEFELRDGPLPPFQITRVEAEASGWDFDSEVSDLRLILR